MAKMIDPWPELVPRTVGRAGIVMAALSTYCECGGLPRVIAEVEDDTWSAACTTCGRSTENGLESGAAAARAWLEFRGVIVDKDSRDDLQLL